MTIPACGQWAAVMVEIRAFGVLRYAGNQAEKEREK